jgi:hypothetical protein
MQTLVYNTSSEGTKTPTEWSIAVEEQKVEIHGQNKNSNLQLEYSPLFTLQRYLEEHKQDKTKLLEVVRKENNLFVSQNKNATKILKLPNIPWIQEFKFGFKPFLEQTNQKEYSFCIVYAKDISLHEMIATKEKIEPLEVEGKSYEAQKLKITLKGFKKKFWKAEAWFDTKTHLLLKYKANEGPATPITEVTLLKQHGS